MINSLFQEPRYSLPFTNFRSKPNVLKRKVDPEFAKREWDVCSDGFSANSPHTFDKKTNKNGLKRKTANGPQVDTGPKSSSKKTKTNLHPIDSTCPNVDSISPQDSKEFSVKENEAATKNLVSSKHPGSVFLEVQNIKSSFQKNNFGVEPKPLVRLSSEFSKKLKAEIINDKRNWSKKELGTISVKSAAQVRDKYHKTNLQENKYSELKNIPNKVGNSKIQLNHEPSVKTISDLPNDASALKHVDNLKKAPDSFKIETFVDLSKALTDLPSLPTTCVIEDEQIRNALIDIKSPELLENGKSNFLKSTNQIIEKVKLQKGSNSLICDKSAKINEHSITSRNDDKSAKVNEHSKASRNDVIPRKMLAHQNLFENSFRTPVPVSKTPKIENVPKKVKVDKCAFNFPSPLPAPSPTCKVKKINISELAVACESRVTSIVEKSSNFDFPSARAVIPLLTESNQNNESASQGDSCRSEMSLTDFSRLLENRFDGGNKGSSWMQGLKPNCEEEDICLEEPVKKKLRNIVPGGLAEKMLKLQRRENSEKVIWSHKIHRNKRKAQNDSLCLILNSISTIDDFIIGKSSLATPEDVRNLFKKDGDTEGRGSHQHSDADYSHLRLKRDEFKEAFESDFVFILFKQKGFAKLQLKVRDVFKLYQPWQTIRLQSIPYPLILCAYFIDKVASLDSRVTSEKHICVADLRELPPLLRQNYHPETTTQGDLLFFKKDELVTFCARIQRVFKKEFKGRNLDGSYSGSTYLRYSVLLQIKEGTFHELRILPDSIPNEWYDSICEGKCYRFLNLGVTHRTSLKRDKSLRDILKAFHEQNESKVQQGFLYQLMFGSSSTCPEEVLEAGFPDYCPFLVDPLVDIFKFPNYTRFTGIAKVLLQHKDVFYISGKSLLESPTLKYIQVQFLMATEIRPLLTGCVVLVKEALVEEGSLLIDKYSQIIILTEVSQAYQELSQENKLKVRNQMDVCLNNVLPLLCNASKVEDLVYVKGVVSGVDESTAFTWLHCSFCHQENLVQDTNLVIYCEDCSRIVPSPVLNVKLEVVVRCPQLPSAVVNIQLLSSTIKRILQIPEATCQPQCSVSDVLNKEIGPLLCYVQNCDTSKGKTTFHLLEVD